MIQETFSDPTHIVNQVKDVYNGQGQVVAEYQSHGGAAVAGTTAAVSYSYSSVATGSLPLTMTYPSGQVIHYGYDGNALDAAIGRLSYLADDNGFGGVGNHIESYQYQGVSTVLNQTDGEGVTLTIGLDAFGNLADQNYQTSSNVSIGHLKYARDRDGNVTAQTNVLETSLNQTFTFDSLGRITATTLGGAAYQSWTLDAQGNASSITTNGVAVSQSTNGQNQLTAVGGSALAYDKNGNLSADNQGRKYTYDAWNRLVGVKDASGNAITGYAYDALGRRIAESPAGIAAVSDLYYSTSWQVVETRQSDVKTYQNVWGAAFVDDLVRRTTFVGGSQTQQLYFLHDADWNVIAAIDPGVADNGGVVERYRYDQYGAVTILNPDFSVKAAKTTVDGVRNLYQGKSLDAATGLYDSRGRVYSPDLERFLQQDPGGYVDGDSLYAGYFAMTGGVDPSGLNDRQKWDPDGYISGWDSTQSLSRPKDFNSGVNPYVAQLYAAIRDPMSNSAVSGGAVISVAQVQKLAAVENAKQGVQSVATGVKMAAMAIPGGQVAAAADAINNTAAAVKNPSKENWAMAAIDWLTLGWVSGIGSAGDRAASRAVAAKDAAEADMAVEDAATLDPHDVPFYSKGEAANAVRLHHSWPMYLGGRVNQKLVSLPKNVHDAFHVGLDRILPRTAGTEYYESLSPAAREQALRDLGAYTKSFDTKYGTKLYQAMVGEGFPY